MIGRPAKNVPRRRRSTTSPATPSPTISRRATAGTAPNISDTSPFKADWIKHKSFDGSCPLGPWIVPASDIKRSAEPRPQAVGQRRPQAGFQHQGDDLQPGRADRPAVERLTLHPGDLILTGTPAGVGVGARRIPQGRRRGEALDREDRRPDQQDGLMIGVFRLRIGRALPCRTRVTEPTSAAGCFRAIVIYKVGVTDADCKRLKDRQERPRRSEK